MCHGIGIEHPGLGAQWLARDGTRLATARRHAADRSTALMRGNSVALSVTHRARHTESGLDGRQARITKLVLAERDMEPICTPSFTSPLHRAFRTCGPRRLRRGD